MIRGRAEKFENTDCFRVHNSNQATIFFFRSCDIFFKSRVKNRTSSKLDCKTFPLFLSFFCRSVLEISMHDAGMCDAQVNGSHSRRDPSPTRSFHTRSRSFMIRFHPKRHTLKYRLFCSLPPNQISNGSFATLVILIVTPER